MKEAKWGPIRLAAQPRSSLFNSAPTVAESYSQPIFPSPRRDPDHFGDEAAALANFSLEASP